MKFYVMGSTEFDFLMHNDPFFHVGYAPKIPFLNHDFLFALAGGTTPNPIILYYKTTIFVD